MSVEAMAWALDATRTGPMSDGARLVLIVLADYSGHDGRHAYPSKATIAERLGMSQRTVRRHLAALREDGQIEYGDQRHVLHIPADRRPTVYDLVMTERNPQPVDNHPERGVNPDPPVIHRGVKSGTHGGSELTPKPRTKPNYETPVVPATVTRLPLVECPVCHDTFRDHHECPGPQRRKRRRSEDDTQQQRQQAHPLAGRLCPDHLVSYNARGICSCCRADQIAAPPREDY